MRTLPGSELAIGFYPRFIYDSSGGGGIASASRSGSSRLDLEFDPAKVSIPDVSGRSSVFSTCWGLSTRMHFTSVIISRILTDVCQTNAATFLGVPMLPYLRIAIKPTKLEVGTSMKVSVQSVLVVLQLKTFSAGLP